MARRRMLPFVGGSSYFKDGAAFKNSGLQSYENEDLLMTKKDVVNKLGICFSVLLFFSVVGYCLTPNFTGTMSVSNISATSLGFGAIIIPIALIATLILGFVNAFARVPKPWAIVTYSVFEGLLMGAISSSLGHQYQGIVPTAIFATLSVVTASYLVYTTGLIKPNGKFFAFLAIAIGGYFLFTIVNLILMLFGVFRNGFGLYSTQFGPVISVFAILLGALMLIGDLAIIDMNVGKVNSIYAWSCAYGIMLDVIWIYFEILRLLAILNERK